MICFPFLFRKPRRLGGDGLGNVVVRHAGFADDGEADGRDAAQIAERRREKLQVGTTGKTIVFTKENFSFAARIMEGPYLAVSQVLSNLKQQFTVLTDAALLRDTILQALSVTGTQNRFSLSFAGNRLTVRCESEYGISETAMDVVALSGDPVGVYWYNPAQLMECLKALNGTLMLEVVQHSALLLKTDELVCFQMAVREPKAIESKPQKTKKPRKEAA